MQNYTQQQQKGGVKYAPRTLVGNWNEDIELQRAVLTDFLSKKETGRLKIETFQQRMAIALAEVELTRIRDDPYVHFGDLLQLVHGESGAALACDVEDKDTRPGEDACTATATTEFRLPVARNTFLIAKYRPARPSPQETYYDDDVLRYGEKIRLVANPLAQNQELTSDGGPRPLYLFSRPISINNYAKFSRHQLVGFTSRDTYDAVWQVATPDPSERIAAEGVEVMAGAPLLLVHCATSKPLCLEQGAAQRYPNDFGMELEVTAHQAVSAGMQQGLEHLTMGKTTKALPKSTLSPNHWVFLTGATVATLPTTANGCEEAAGPLLARMQEELSTKHGAGVGALERKLVTWQNTHGELPTTELLLVLRQLGVSISEDDMCVLDGMFRSGKSGVISAAALLKALQN